MFTIQLLFYLVYRQIRCEFKQLYENFNELQISDLGNWICLNSPNPEVYQCQYGMDLIKVDQTCSQIEHEITGILPHFQVQIYIDIYGYGDLQINDNIAIILDQQNIWQTDNTFLPIQLQPLGKSHSCISYSSDKNYQIRKTFYKKFDHNSENLKLELKSTLSANFESKSFLFRNLQILYNQCYKTCKTCSNDLMNQCTLCYDNIPLISGTCSTCQQKDDLTFLLIPKGCVVQCPDGYNYDKDKVCYQNQKLITYSNSQLTKIKEDYQISGSLEQSAILLRLTLKVQLIGKNKFFDLKINGQYIAYINRFQIYSKVKYDYLQKMQNQIILEFNYPINSEQFIIQIDANKQKQNFQAPEVKIQYLVCALNCQKCKNNKICEICKPSYYLYQGECFNNCPVYTTQSDQTCVDSDEKINYDENQEVIILVKEFCDLSTTQERINELFNVVVNSGDNYNNYNFQKGDGIYFSYFGNKRIFGGPFVWVNAKFQFHLNLQNIQQIVYVKFEVILGDEQMSREQFHYQINSEVKKSLQINENKQLHYDQNWQDNYFIDVIQVIETIQYQDDHENALDILFHCDNAFENANTTFCGIQNLIISFQTVKQDQSDSSDQDYINDEDMDNIFEISICGDGKVSYDEECDDGNLIPFDGCFNCEYSCEQLCQFCVKGECLLMFEQQQQSQIFQNTFIISQELNENKFSCIMIDCEVCIQGICLQCKIGYYMNYINNQCESICGDLIIQGLEQCDDGNLDDYDGCSDCQLIVYENCIMLQTCAVCHYDKCLKCNDGYTLENNICISICGDALINKLEEQCDNPNEIGCINCQIEKGYICYGQSYSICKTCSNYCIDCQTINQQNLICKDCIIGYYPVQDNCLECDKNCITCKIQSNLCTSCYRSDCEICESIPGYYTDFQIKRCVTLCGDGILAKEQEECDDGNIENDDGCDSQCKIEIPQNYINDLLVWQFTGNTTYDFQLKNSEYQLQLNCQNPFIIIDGISTNDYSFNITLINKTCSLQFEYFTSIFKHNIIHVELSLQFNQNRLLNENNENNVRSVKFDIQPNEQIIISQDQQQQAQQIANVQQSFNFLFVIIIPVSIVTNLYDYLWAVLEILSWVNNFYFLNVNYPFNVEMFLLNSDWSSFVTLPTYQGLNQPDCSYYFTAPQKFQNKGIDPLFFNNIQIPFIFILIIFLIYEFNFIILFFFNTLNQLEIKKQTVNHKHFSIFNLQVKRKTQQTQFQQQQQDKQKTQQTQVQQQQNQQNLQNNSIVNQIVGYFIVIDKKLKNKLKQTLSLCMLDITLAIMLQITFSNNNSNIIVGLNQFFAIISINIIIFQLYQSYQTLNIHILLAENKQYKEQFEIYYENVNTEESFGYYFKFFGLIRKILYIFFMVHYYYYPIFQTLLCFVSTSIGVVFILYQNPYNSKREFYTQLISEFSLSIILLIAVSFSINDTQQIIFIQHNKITLGWVVIAFVILAIFIQICGLIYGLMIHIYQLFLKIKNYYLNIRKDNHSIKKQQENINNDPSQLEGQQQIIQFNKLQLNEKQEIKRNFEQLNVIEQ